MTPTAPPTDTIRFLCPQCNAGLSVPSKLAGVKGPCPHCGTEIIAPNPATNQPASLSNPPTQQPFQSAPEASPAKERKPTPTNPASASSSSAAHPSPGSTAPSTKPDSTPQATASPSPKSTSKAPTPQSDAAPAFANPNAPLPEAKAPERPAAENMAAPSALATPPATQLPRPEASTASAFASPKATTPESPSALPQFEPPQGTPPSSTAPTSVAPVLAPAFTTPHPENSPTPAESAPIASPSQQQIPKSPPAFGQPDKANGLQQPLPQKQSPPLTPDLAPTPSAVSPPKFLPPQGNEPEVGKTTLGAIPPVFGNPKPTPEANTSADSLTNTPPIAGHTDALANAPQFPPQESSNPDRSPPPLNPPATPADFSTPAPTLASPTGESPFPAISPGSTPGPSTPATAMPASGFGSRPIGERTPAPSPGVTPTQHNQVGDNPNPAFQTSPAPGNAPGAPAASPSRFALPGQPETQPNFIPAAQADAPQPPFAGKRANPETTDLPPDPSKKRPLNLKLPTKALAIAVPVLLLIAAGGAVALKPSLIPDNLRHKIVFWKKQASPPENSTNATDAVMLKTEQESGKNPLPTPSENTPPGIADTPDATALAPSESAPAQPSVAEDERTTETNPAAASDSEPDPNDETAQLLDKIRDPDNPAAGALDKPMEALNAFLAAPTWNTRIHHSLHPERVGVLMKKYYLSNPDEPIIPTSIRYQHSETDEATDTTFYVFHLTTEQAEAGFPVAIEETEYGYKVDWEAFVEFKDNLFQQFAQNPQPGTSGQFHVIVRKTHYFDKDFPEIENLTPYRIDPPIPDQDKTAFVNNATPVGNEIGSKVDWGSPFTPLIELTWRESEAGTAYLEITKIIFENWRTVARYRENADVPNDSSEEPATAQETAATGTQ